MGQNTSIPSFLKRLLSVQCGVPENSPKHWTKIAENTDTDVRKIFTEDINTTSKDILSISKTLPEKQKEIIAKVENKI